MHTIIGLTQGLLNRKALLNETISNIYDDNEYFAAARMDIFYGNFGQGDVVLTGNVRGEINAGHKVVFSPGTRISPSTGFVKVKINPLCE